MLFFALRVERNWRQAGAGDAFDSFGLGSMGLGLGLATDANDAEVASFGLGSSSGGGGSSNVFAAATGAGAVGAAGGSGSNSAALFANSPTPAAAAVPAAARAGAGMSATATATDPWSKPSGDVWGWSSPAAGTVAALTSLAHPDATNMFDSWKTVGSQLHGLSAQLSSHENPFQAMKCMSCKV